MADDDRTIVSEYYFAPIPEDLLYSDLTDLAVRVYGVLMRHGLTAAECFPSHARIGELVGKSERSMNRPLNELARAGWISKTPRRIGNLTVGMSYTVHVAAQESAPTTRTYAVDHAEERALGPRSGTRRTRGEPDNDKKEEAARSDARNGAGGEWRSPPDEDPDWSNNADNVRAMRESIRVGATEEEDDDEDD